jgi:NuA3 HAT complex component NTO1
MDKLYYVTTIPFARDLCQAIHVGINTTPAPASQGSRTEPVEASPSKYNNFAEVGARKRLGKRILKLLQPYLEATLKNETEITRQEYEPLHKVLEAMLEASVEVRPQPATSITVSDAAPSQSQDIDMADAPAEGQIIVADHSEGEEDAEGEPDDANIDVGGYAEQENEQDDQTPKPNGLLSAAQSVAGEMHFTNGFGNAKPSPSPPSLPGASYVHLDHHHPGNNTAGAGPLTPPRSNTGSASAASFTTTTTLLPNNNNPPTITVTNTNSSTGIPATATTGPVSATHNPLTDGGILWYLKDFELIGTTCVDPDGDIGGDGEVGGVGKGWTNGREAALRSLSEELTDLDEEALRDLGRGVTVDATGESVEGGDADAAGEDDADAVGEEDDRGEGVGENEEGEGGVEGGGEGEDEEGAEDAEGEMDVDVDVDGEGEVDDVDGDADEMTITFAGDGDGDRPSSSSSSHLNGGTAHPNTAAGTGRAGTQLNGGGVAVSKKVQTVVTTSAGSGGSSPRKRTRSEVAAAAAARGRGRFSLRKGVRSSARRK